MESKRLKKMLNVKIDELKKNKWKFLHENFPVVERKRFHRKKLRSTKPNCKNVILNKLNYIAPFVFLQFYGSLGQQPGPYYEIDKGCSILFQLLQGCPGITFSLNYSLC